MAGPAGSDRRPLPVGTQVVTLVPVGGARIVPAGVVATVIAAPQQAGDDGGRYRLRFPDGDEAEVARGEVAVRAQLQRAGLEALPTSASTHELYRHVIYRCVMGSRAYGLDEEGSDTDRRGIYLPPAERHWSLYGVPEQLENEAAQETYWEIEKFLVLALKANPNVLECLYSPLVELAAPPAQELLALRHIFLSRLVYQTYNGYVLSQFKKLEQDRRTRGQLRWKHAMHLIRLLLAGVTILQDGVVPIQVGEQRERLLAIRRGETPWEEVEAWRLVLHRQFDAAYAATRLPERPDYARADAYLIAVRRSMVS